MSDNPRPEVVRSRETTAGPVKSNDAGGPVSQPTVITDKCHIEYTRTFTRTYTIEGADPESAVVDSLFLRPSEESVKTSIDRMFFSKSSPAPSPPPSSASSTIDQESSDKVYLGPQTTSASVSANGGHGAAGDAVDEAMHPLSPSTTLDPPRTRTPKSQFPARNDRRRCGAIPYTRVKGFRRRPNIGRDPRPFRPGPDRTRTWKQTNDTMNNAVTRARTNRPGVDVCAKLWGDELNTRKIRNHPDEETEWYESHGETMLSSPPAGVQELPFDPREQPFPIGRLHVHTQQLPHSPERTIQAWMWARDEAGPHRRQRSGAGTQWIAVEPGDMHPRLPGYVLHFTPAGKPSWIREASAQSYEPKDKMEARIARMARRG